MPTQEVIASPVTRKDRADQEFRSLFTAMFAPLAHAVDRVVGDRAAAGTITRDAFLQLLTHWRKVGRQERPDVWVRRLALREAERAAAASPPPPHPVRDDLDERAAIVAWEADTERAYDAVLARARRRTVRRNVALGGAAAAVALVVAAVLLPGGAHPPPPAAPAAFGPPPWVTGPRAQPLGGPLDGQWTTDPLTRADVANALRRAGLADYAEHAASFPDGQFRIRLTVDSGRSVLTVAGHRDVRIFRVDEQRVTLEALPPNVEITHFRWSGEGPWMTLAFVGPGLAKHGDLPSPVHEVALYTTARFERARG